LVGDGKLHGQNSWQALPNQDGGGAREDVEAASLGPLAGVEYGQTQIGMVGQQASQLCRSQGLRFAFVIGQHH
jgi:hypothetical protein